MGDAEGFEGGRKENVGTVGEHGAKDAWGEEAAKGEYEAEEDEKDEEDEEDEEDE